MGVTITAKNSGFSFDMGYGGFWNLRNNIALALDEEFGNDELREDIVKPLKALIRRILKEVKKYEAE